MPVIASRLGDEPLAQPDEAGERDDAERDPVEPGHLSEVRRSTSETPAQDTTPT